MSRAKNLPSHPLKLIALRPGQSRRGRREWEWSGIGAKARIRTEAAEAAVYKCHASKTGPARSARRKGQGRRNRPRWHSTTPPACGGVCGGGGGGDGGRGKQKNPLPTLAEGLDGERIIIESNRQREKTASERMHEADNLTRIFAEEGRRKMLAGKPIDPPAMLREGTRHERETVAQVAEAVGMKPRTYAKVKNVHDTANDEKAAEPVRAVAQQQMAALDAGRLVSLSRAVWIL